MDPDQSSHSSLPLSPVALPPLAPAGQPPSPWCFVVLLWLFKSFVKAPGLTQQQRIGQSDSTSNPPPLPIIAHISTLSSFLLHLCPVCSPLLCPPSLLISALLMSSLYVFSLSLLLLLRRVSCSLLGHNHNPRHSCHTTLFSHIIRAWAWAWARITFMWLFPFTTIWSGRWHILSWTHAKCSAWPECLVLGISETSQRMSFFSALCFALKEVGIWLLWAL